MKGFIFMSYDAIGAINAMIIKSATEGEKIPNIERLIDRKLNENERVVFKKEEIDDFVAKFYGFDLDSSISGAVSNALKKLEEDGKVAHIRHGHWSGK